MPVRTFTKYAEYLVTHGYTTISATELVAYLKHNAPIPEKSCLLTFDDGYTSHYTIVFPILNRLALRGVFFVSPRLVESGTARTTLDDQDESFLETEGYTRWSELDIMDKSGVCDIQSHALSHSLVFIDSKVLDFYDGEQDLNLCSDIYSGYLEPGAPLYKTGNGLIHRAFIPTGYLKQRVLNYAVQHGGTAFFQRQDWRSFLLSKFRGEVARGRFESRPEYIERVRLELEESKRLLEIRLKKHVLLLAWPWGRGSEAMITIARDAGYDGIFETHNGRMNAYGYGSALHINRVGARISEVDSLRYHLVYRDLLYVILSKMRSSRCLTASGGGG